jgi:BirA family biotin operon repressor/biotin-[acetyl-CoA-carboxylase] ligase
MPDGGATSDGGTAPGPRFTAVRRLAETDSTNREALTAARAGAPEGLVVVAVHQTAGRGRDGRSWLAPPGSSLLVSVLLRPPPSLGGDRVHEVTKAAALAAADACREVAGVEPGFKWPNDLLVGDRKLAGLLAEAEWDGHGGLAALVVGLGLNVNWPAELPVELDGIAVALNHVVGHPVDRDALLDAFLRNFAARYERACENG